MSDIKRSSQRIIQKNLCVGTCRLHNLCDELEGIAKQFNDIIDNWDSSDKNITEKKAEIHRLTQLGNACKLSIEHQARELDELMETVETDTGDEDEEDEE
tara:strand:- start:259 stop:558 length:300 start_codon:yes stop_codon:yes gene_type:complete